MTIRQRSYNALSLLAITCGLLLSHCFASTTVNATMVGPDGQPVKFAFLQFDLKYCGFNIPVAPGSGGIIVAKSKRFTQSQLPAQIFGNDELTCGNSYSTLWHVTAYADPNTPIAGDKDYVICSSLATLAYCPAPSGTWNLAQAQPFTNATPPPGFQQIFGNPLQTQTITQPANTRLKLVGLGSGGTQGAIDFTNIQVIGLSGIGINATQLFGNPVCSSPPGTSQVLTWNGTNWCSAPVPTNSNAAFLQGTPISGTAGTANQVLRWISGTWTPDSLSDFLSRSGGTMTGVLTLSGVPTLSLHAATKGYVDGLIAGKADLSGGLVPTAELGSGSFNASNCLFQNQTWNLCGGLSTIVTNTNGGLAGGGTGSSLTLTLGTCPNGNVWQSNGSTWSCQPTGAGTLTALTGSTTDGINTLNCTAGSCTIKLRQDCSSGQVQQWNSGTSHWDCASVSGVPGGSSLQFQYNNSGAFAGSSCLTQVGTVITLGSTCQITLSGGMFISSTVPGIQPSVPGAGTAAIAVTTDGNVSSKCATCTTWQPIENKPNLAAVTFSATPNFNFTGPGGGTFTLTLTGNVTSSTLNSTTLVAGETVSFKIVQDATGSRTFVWPSQVVYPQPVIANAASENTLVTFLWDGTSLIPTGTPTIYP